MMRPWLSIGSPRSRALLRASPLTPPLTRSPSTRPHGRGVRRSSFPPARPATVSGHGSRSLARDRTIPWVKTLGRCRWKPVSGSHRQGRVENTCFRDTSSSARAFAPGVQPGRGVRSSSACLFTISEEWALRWPSPAAPLAKRRLGRRWSDRVLGGPLRGRRTVWSPPSFPTS